MIKRLKWNTLYGSDGSGAESSGDSDDDDYERASAALQQLVQNDPVLNRVDVDVDVDVEGDNSVREQNSEDDDDEAEAEEEASTDATCPVVTDEGETQRFIEWRECNLCPGKRFLNDREVEAHLASKAHLRALKRYEKLQQATKQNANADGVARNEQPSLSKVERRKQRRIERLRALTTGGATGASAAHGDEQSISATANDVGDGDTDTAVASVATSSANDNGDEAAARADVAAEARRKQAVKRKLKMMKERKWKKRQAAEKAAAEQANGMGEKGNNGSQVKAKEEEGTTANETLRNEGVMVNGGGEKDNSHHNGKRKKKRPAEKGKLTSNKANATGNGVHGKNGVVKGGAKTKKRRTADNIAT